MTTKNTVEKEQKQTQNQQSLKGVLADVLEKNKQTPPSPAPKNEVRSSTQSPSPMPVPRVEEKKPFEVSEDTLQKVFKDET